MNLKPSASGLIEIPFVHKYQPKSRQCEAFVERDKESTGKFIRNKVALECRKMTTERWKFATVRLFVYVSLHIKHSFMVMSEACSEVSKSSRGFSRQMACAKAFQSIAPSTRKSRLFTPQKNKTNRFDRLESCEKIFPSPEAKINSLLALRFSLFRDGKKFLWSEKICLKVGRKSRATLAFLFLLFDFVSV